MSWFAIGATVVSVGLNYKGAKDAKKAAFGSAQEEQRLEGLLTEEKVRQLNVDKAQVLGQQRAGYAAAGVRVGVGGQEQGSVMDILEETSYNFLREIQTTEETGASRSASALQNARNISKQYQNQANQSAMSGIASIASIWDVRGPGKT